MNIVLDRPTLPKGNVKELSSGIEVPLTPEQTGEVVFTKYVSTDQQATTFIPEYEWEEEVTAHARILMGDRPRERGAVHADDGLIIRFVGTPRGEVGMADRRIMTQEEAAEQEEAFGRRVPRFTAWDFRLKWIKITDGPRRREALHRSAEEAREEEFSELAKTLRLAISPDQKANIDNLDAQSIINSLSSEQLQAALEVKMAEQDMLRMDQEAKKAKK